MDAVKRGLSSFFTRRTSVTRADDGGVAGAVVCDDASLVWVEVSLATGAASNEFDVVDRTDYALVCVVHCDPRRASASIVPIRHAPLAEQPPQPPRLTHSITTLPEAPRRPRSRHRSGSAAPVLELLETHRPGADATCASVVPGAAHPLADGRVRARFSSSS